MTAIPEWSKDRMAFPPVTVEADGGVKLCIVEADLLDYPGLYLYNGDGDCTLEGRFARVPARYARGGRQNLPAPHNRPQGRHGRERGTCPGGP